MATERMTYADEQAEMPNALEDTEIARLMKLVSESGYKKSEEAPTLKKQAFMPRSLVEIAMESQKNREQKEIPTNTETNQKGSINQSADIDVQGEGTISDDPTGDSSISDELTSQTKDTELTDLAPPSLSDKNIIRTEVSQQPNTQDENLDADKNSEEADVLQASPLPKNNKDDENAKSEITQNKTSGFNKEILTEAELSKAVENASARYDEGFNAGLEAGRNEIKKALEQKFSEKQNTFESLIAKLTSMSSAETKELEADIQAAILSLASERAGIAILEMPENFMTRIEQLMSRLGSSLDSPIIKLNMADLRHIEAAKENSEKLSNIRIIGDETLNHGDISISLAGIEIEDIIENRTFVYPIDVDLETDMEQPYSELHPDKLVRPETVDKNTLKDDISDDINENTTDQEEAQASPNQEIGDQKQNIEDENSDINPSDGVA